MKRKGKLYTSEYVHGVVVRSYTEKNLQGPGGSEPCQITVRTCVLLQAVPQAKRIQRPEPFLFLPRANHDTRVPIELAAVVD